MPATVSNVKDEFDAVVADVDTAFAQYEEKPTYKVVVALRKALQKTKKLAQDMRTAVSEDFKAKPDAKV